MLNYSVAELRENKLEKLREPEFREDLAPMIYWDDEYDDMKVTDDITL